MADESTDPSRIELPRGRVIGERYEIESLLGEGGVGQVYRARHLTLGRSVALKVLLAQHEGREALRERFRREAAALAGLSHPHIVAVTDFGVDGDTLFLVMELLDGQSLAELLAGDGITPARGLDIVRQILLALSYAHARKVVHRDLKPHNIFVRRLDDGSDHVTVLDFGLARFIGGRGSGAQLTHAGMLIGTPAYMAPEQASGDVDAIDARTDVYAAGLLLFEVLCGRRPFLTKEPGALMRAHLLETPPTLAQSHSGLGASEKLEALVAKALAKQPEDRFASATEMLAALDALGNDAVRDAAPRRRSRERVSVEEANTIAAGPGAKRSSLEIAPPTPKKKNRFLVVAIGAMVVAFGAIAVIAWMSSEDPEPTVRPPVVAPPPATPDAGPPPRRSNVRNPFAEPMPEPLASAYAQVRARRRLSKTQIREVRGYYREHPDDAARAHLVLAHNFFLHRPLSVQTMPEYDDAMAADPNVRGDPQMLPELLWLVRTAWLHRTATEFIVRWYGREALPAVDALLARGDLQSPDPERLQSLRRRILAAPQR